MFIRSGLEMYVEKHKNGIQVVEFDKENSWHNFHKNLENNNHIIKVISKLNLKKIYGGQAEGNFFEKDVFHEIANVYINIYCKSILQEVNMYKENVYDTKDENIIKYINDHIIIDYFENEEVVLQTIFVGLNIKYYTIPFTLQNYGNYIEYTIEFIDNLIDNKIIIQDKTSNRTLKSPHDGKNIDTIFSIKRVNRNLNPLRIYLNNKM